MMVDGRLRLTRREAEDVGRREQLAYVALGNCRKCLSLGVIRDVHGDLQQEHLKPTQTE